MTQPQQNPNPNQMQKLESVTIEGFQAHDSLQIDLDPGITTIVGPTNVGKSSIIRALKWATLNSYRGFDFLRTGAKVARVGFRAGPVVLERTRGKDRNGFGLSEGPSPPKLFDAVAGTVPPEISEVLKIEEDNFQSQHDPAFWISQSAGEVARCLNKRVSLDVIDRHLSGAAALVRRLGIAKDLALEAFNTARDKYRDLDFVDFCSEGFQNLTIQKQERDSLVQKCDRLSPMIFQLREQKAAVKGFTSCLSDGEAALRFGEEWTALENKRKRLAALVEQVAAQKKAAAVEVPSISCLVDLQEAATESRRRHQWLKDLIQEAAEWHHEIKTRTKEIDLEVEKLESVLEKGCPLCNR